MLTSSSLNLMHSVYGTFLRNVPEDFLQITNYIFGEMFNGWMWKVVILLILFLYVCLVDKFRALFTLYFKFILIGKIFQTLNLSKC